MRALLKSLNQRPIALYPAYIKITGSLAGGALLSQCMYWFGKKDKFHKTDAEFIDELGLSAGEMRGAKSKVKALAFINVTRKGVPAKTWYSIDWEAYQDTMTVQFSEINQTGENSGFLGNLSLVKFTKLDKQNSQNWFSEINQTIYSSTKITTKTTAKSKRKKQKLDLSKIDPPKNLNIKAWQLWMDYKKHKKPYSTEIGIKTAMNQLAEVPYENQMACIKNSVGNEYQGFFTKDYIGIRNANNTKETTFEREEREHKEYLQQRERFMGDHEGEISEPLGGAQRLKLL